MVVTNYLLAGMIFQVGDFPTIFRAHHLFVLAISEFCLGSFGLVVFRSFEITHVFGQKQGKPFFSGGSITKSVDRSVGPSKWKPCPSKTPAFFSNGFNVRIRSDIAMVLVCGSVFIFSFWVFFTRSLVPNFRPSRADSEAIIAIITCLEYL